MKRPDKQYLHELDWEQKAQQNPLYAVMSVDEFAESGVPTPEEIDRFYGEGREKVAKLIQPWLSESGTTDEMSILEFGCGMGRLVNALRNVHPPENLFGVDISPTMVDYAKKYVGKPSRFEVIGQDGGFPFSERTFDRIYSYAVFQHIADWTVVKRAIAQLCDALVVGGKMKLQFWMAGNPSFELMPRLRSYAIGEVSVQLGWKRVAGFPLFGARLAKSNHWGGCRPGYKQLVRAFKSGGVRIHGIVREYPKTGYVWLYGEKT